MRILHSSGKKFTNSGGVGVGARKKNVRRLEVWENDSRRGESESGAESRETTLLRGSRCCKKSEIPVKSVN